MLWHVPLLSRLVSAKRIQSATAPFLHSGLPHFPKHIMSLLVWYMESSRTQRVRQVCLLRGLSIFKKLSSDKLSHVL
ncbi:hypothetical protein FOXYSP1_13539 [Fusarium oxysporum f. sp. phaseoli]